MHTEYRTHSRPFFSTNRNIRSGRILPFLLAPLVLIVAGCVSTHKISHQNPNEYRQVTRAAIEETARVHLDGGRTLELSHLRVTADSTTGVSDWGQRRSLPTSAILEVEVVDRGGGALRGAGIGFLSSLGIGAIGVASSDNPLEGLVAVFTTLAITIPGTLIGGGIGAAVGNRESYQFSSPPREADSIQSAHNVRMTENRRRVPERP